MVHAPLPQQDPSPILFSMNSWDNVLHPPLLHLIQILVGFRVVGGLVGNGGVGRLFGRKEAMGDVLGLFVVVVGLTVVVGEVVGLADGAIDEGLAFAAEKKLIVIIPLERTTTLITTFSTSVAIYRHNESMCQREYSKS